MSELPSSWTETSLGDVTNDCLQKVPAEDKTFLYIDIASVDREKKLISSPQKLLGKDAPSRARKLIHEGDVLVSMTRPNLNAVAIVPEELAGHIASTGFDVLRAAEIDPRWVFYTVRSTRFIERMEELVQGALYPAVRGKDIRSYEIPLAPLPEQKRIADKLDSVLARVDACRDRLDRLPALLKRFRQSILAAATSGVLTEDRRCPTKPTAQEHPQLTQFRDQLLWKLPSTWSWQPFSVIASVASDLRAPKDFLSAIHLAPNHIESGTGRILGCVTIAEDKVTSPKHLFRAGQIIYSKIRPNLCKVTIPDFSGLCSADMYPIETSMNPKYLWLWMLSQQFTDWASNAESRTVLPKINQVQLSKIPTPVPPPAEQTEIVRRVEILFAFADRLEARLASARRQVGQLTPALLAKAFRGELVVQDPADEPATELLKRLAAQREAAPKAKRTRAKS
jgi:type I restriction enzyme S subunit